jgi:hypothetical protein
MHGRMIRDVRISKAQSVHEQKPLINIDKLTIAHADSEALPIQSPMHEIPKNYDCVRLAV